MKILVTYPLSQKTIGPGLGDLVDYRPELADLPQDALQNLLADQLPDAALIPAGESPTSRLPSAAETLNLGPRWIPCLNGEPLGPCQDPTLRSAVHLPADLKALALAERQVMQRRSTERLAPHGVSARGSESLRGASVTLVGAGIVNLMTALELSRQGADVQIFDAAPDPRSRPPWQQLGATHGGGNARMFCFTEADNYNEKGHSVYAKMYQVFRHTITDGGWLAVEPERFDQREQAWIDRFHAVPQWRAEVFTEDIHRFSISSYPLWKQWQQTAPELFHDVGFTPGVLRLYNDEAKVRAAEQLHQSLGSLTRALDCGELADRHPACADAVDSGEIAGAIEVRGFTLNIHPFVERLLAQLQTEGVRCHWNRRVHSIERGADGSVIGLGTDREILRSRHYVLSPGVYGGRLLEGTRSADKLQGILGLWLTLPNLEPRLQRSIKIHREGHVGEDSNVTVGRDAQGRPILLLGSGYGYLGSQTLDMGSAQIATLFDALEQAAERYFPRAYRAAVDSGMMADRKACVRPFTSTSLGVFEVLSTDQGGRLVVASGHNTGGFAQAPAVAEAVTDTLRGKAHAMQFLYDPERGIRPDALMD